MTRVHLPRDLTSEQGVLQAVAAIRDYWWKRGYRDVEAWPMRSSVNHRKQPIWGVRSNLINGNPPMMGKVSYSGHALHGKTVSIIGEEEAIARNGTKCGMCYRVEMPEGHVILIPKEKIRVLVT